MNMGETNNPLTSKCPGPGAATSKIDARRITPTRVIRDMHLLAMKRFEEGNLYDGIAAIVWAAAYIDSMLNTMWESRRFCRGVAAALDVCNAARDEGSTAARYERVWQLTQKIQDREIVEHVCLLTKLRNKLLHAEPEIIAAEGGGNRYSTQRPAVIDALEAANIMETGSDWWIKRATTPKVVRWASKTASDAFSCLAIPMALCLFLTPSQMNLAV